MSSIGRSSLALEPRYRPLVNRLRCFRGLDTHGAMVLATEVGDFRRFRSPLQLMAYFGLVPSEHSSGDRRSGVLPNPLGPLQTNPNSCRSVHSNNRRIPAGFTVEAAPPPHSLLDKPFHINVGDAAGPSHGGSGRTARRCH